MTTASMILSGLIALGGIVYLAYDWLCGADSDIELEDN